jgi:hypothetical protein
MILGDLLDAPVYADGRQLGFVVDVRLVLDGPVKGLLAAPRVVGLLVSARTGATFLGYERTDTNAPALVWRYLAWRHRGTFLVLWEDVVGVTGGAQRGTGDARVDLRPGFRRWSPALAPTGTGSRP